MYSNSTDRKTNNGILFSLLAILVASLGSGIQYSGAQSIVPVSKDIILTPDEEPDVQGEEPDVQGEEPDVQGEEPEPQKEEPPVVGEGEPEVQGEDGTESEEPPTTTPPGKGPIGGLDIANTTQQTLPPAFKIKITFDAIAPATQSASFPCTEWDMGVYVQGKLVRLNDINQPLKFCTNKAIQLKNLEAFVEIPGELVESIKDYQRLSIFSAGSILDNCNPEPMPVDLPEVRKVLADKGSFIDTRVQIKKIQDQVSNGCIEKVTKYSGGWGSCIDTWVGRICENTIVVTNRTLDNLGFLFGSPDYGKLLPENTLGNPESIHVDSCKTYVGTKALYNYRSDYFCLFYTMECPSCAGVRVH